MKTLTPQYLSGFCRELSLLLRSGFTLRDSFLVLHSGNDSKASKALIDTLYISIESGMPLSKAMEDTGRFPQYMVGAVGLGEDSDRLADALYSLSEYYDRRERLSASIRGVVFYPLILLIIMAAVVLVLVTRVLPIFDEIYAQIGTQMSAPAASLVNIGKGLSSASLLLMSVFAVILIGIILLNNIPSMRKAVSRKFGYRFIGRGVSERISAVKFAAAMSIAVSSGLDSEQAMFFAGYICRSAPGMCRKMEECREHLEKGDSLESCLLKSRIFSKQVSHMLALGEKSGRTAELMEEAARRCEEKVISELDERLKRIEPALVIILSLIIGLMLFSVMLPLIGIMSSII